MKKEKQYFIENSVGTFIWSSNFIDEVSQKIVEDGLDTYLKFSILYSDNRSYLKNKLGKQDFCDSDSSGRRLHVWQRDLSSGTYWIITGGNGRGSSYEMDDSIDVNDLMDDLLSVYELTSLKNNVLKNIKLHRITQQ